jgi:hypothetical protein
VFDLGRLQERLNTDDRLYEAFLNDPVGVLRREGLALSRAQEAALRQSVRRSRRPGGGAQANRPRVAGGNRCRLGFDLVLLKLEV